MRTIRKHAHSSASEVMEMLSSLFALEIASPSRCIWLVSPWVSDLVLLDNRFGQFSAFGDQLRRRVTLAEVLAHLASRGSAVVLAVRPGDRNAAFVARLQQLVRANHSEHRLTIHIVPEGRNLHDKALAGDDYVVSGSMNFTFYGTMFNEEQVQLHLDREYVAATHLDLFERFGGVVA